MMPLPKEFYFAGKFTKHQIISALFLLLGIMGAITNLIGFTQNASQNYYVVGSGLLLLPAVYFELTYFIALEIILIAGHGAILLGIGPILQIAIPILLSLQLLIYYWLSGLLKSIFRFIGVIGIALLSIGCSVESYWFYCLGSLAVATFAFYCVFLGKRVVILWGILNSIFFINTASVLLGI